MAKKKQPKEKPIEVLLGDILSKRIIEFKEHYSVIDRVKTMDFNFVFRDSVNSYRIDTVLCERLYKNEFCSKIKYPEMELPKESSELYENIIKSMDEILKEDVTDESQLKIKEYEEQLKEHPPEIIEKEILVYTNSMIDPGYPVVQLKDIDDSVLDIVYKKIAIFVCHYFFTMQFILTDNYKINLFSVDNEDYVDIMAMIESI